MDREYQERLEAWESAVKAKAVADAEAEAMDVVEEEVEEKGERGNDEEVEGGAQGGFTAVNG